MTSVSAQNCSVVSDDQELLYMLSAVRSSDVEAMKKLAAIYGQENCQRSNSHLSFNWYYIAALNKDPIAEHFVGTYYFYGTGVDKDIREATKWFIRASNQGVDGSKMMLRNIYELQLVDADMLIEIKDHLKIK